MKALRQMMKKRIDRAWAFLANHAPTRLCYHAFVRVMVYSTTGKYGDTVTYELKGMEALKRWEHDRARNINE